MNKIRLFLATPMVTGLPDYRITGLFILTIHIVYNILAVPRGINRELGKGI